MGWQMSNYLRDAYIDHVLRDAPYTPPATIYASLVTTAPSADDAGTEVAGITRQATTWGTAIAGRITATSGPEWSPLHGSADQTIVGAKLYDASTSGNLLWWIRFDGTFHVPAGRALTFPDNWATIARDPAGGLTNDHATAWLDHVFGNDTLASSIGWLGAFTDFLDATADGTEVTGGSYLRTEVSMAAGVNGDADSDTDTAFTPLHSDDDQTVSALALHDASSDGTMLLFANRYHPLPVSADNDLQYSAGAVKVRAR